MKPHRDEGETCIAIPTALLGRDVNRKNYF